MSMIPLESSLSLIVTGLLIISLWFADRLRRDLEDRLEDLESEMARALVSIEGRIVEGLKQLVESGLDLPEPPNLVQQALGQWIQSNLGGLADQHRDPGSGQFAEASGDSGDT